MYIFYEFKNQVQILTITVRQRSIYHRNLRKLLLFFNLKI